MPIFRYFLGVGAVLLGLLFVASEFVGNSEPVRFVTTDYTAGLQCEAQPKDVTGRPPW